VSGEYRAAQFFRLGNFWAIGNLQRQQLETRSVSEGKIGSCADCRR
jgi:hypothetical protein